MLKPSYWLSQPEVMLLLHMFDLASDVPLLQGKIDAQVTGSWFHGLPKFACYFEARHYVPVANMNIEGLQPVVRDLLFEPNPHPVACKIQKLLPNAFLPTNLAQGDCAPDAVRLILLVRHTFELSQLSEPERASCLAALDYSAEEMRKAEEIK